MSGDRAPRRPPRWQWVLTAGVVGASVLGSVSSEILGNVINSSIGAVRWPSIGIAVLGLVAIAVLEVRSRRAEQHEAEPPPVEIAPHPGGTLPLLPGFVGRGAEIGDIARMLRDKRAVAVVGRRGAGTSWCAIQAAVPPQPGPPTGLFPLANRQRPPAPVFHYLDLRAGGRPWPARRVLTALATAVGTRPPASGDPGALAEAADALHRGLDSPEVVLVLDNVDDPAQLGPLLPHSAQCRLLLAGGTALEQAEGVVCYPVSEPTADEGAEMLAAAVRAARGQAFRPEDRSAVRELVDLCGRQPRMLRALGYRMGHHNRQPVDMLRDVGPEIAAPPLDGGPLPDSLARVTAWDTAYDALSRPARRLLRLLALVPVPLDRYDMAALYGGRAMRRGVRTVSRPGGVPAPRLRRPAGERADRLLDELATAGFLAGTGGERYAIPGLLAPLARLHLRRDEPASRRVAALTRLLRYLSGHAERHASALPSAPTSRIDPAAQGWFAAHEDMLRGVVDGVPAALPPGEPLPRRVRQAWFRLAVALCGWYAHEGRHDDWVAVCDTVLAAPTAADRPEIAGWAHNELGVLHRRRGDPRSAEAALAAAVGERGRRATAQARMNWGLALLDLGRVRDAVDQLERARRHRAHADRAGQALCDLALGAARLANAQPGRARDDLVRAANVFRTLGDDRGYAAALANLVLAQWQLGEYLDAGESWEAALHEYDSLGDDAGRAAVWLNAGAGLVTFGDDRAEQAYEMLERSRRARDPDRPTAGLGRTLLYLGDAAAALGRVPEARGHWVRSADVCAAVGDEAGRAAAAARLTS